MLTAPTHPTPHLCQLGNRIMPSKTVVTVSPYCRPTPTLHYSPISSINNLCKRRIQYTKIVRDSHRDESLSLSLLSFHFSSRAAQSRLPHSKQGRQWLPKRKREREMQFEGQTTSYFDNWLDIGTVSRQESALIIRDLPEPSYHVKTSKKL